MRESDMTTTRTATFTAFAFFMFFLSFFAIQPAKADTITLASTGTSADAGQTNSMGATVTVTPDPAWLSALPGSSWVSFAATTDSSAGFVAVPNGTVVNFYDTFNVSGTPTSGSITVMADDSATILLNGVALATPTQPSGTSPSCWAFSSGCLSPTTISLPTTLLHAGVNTLDFEVVQLGGASFGLDYLGTVLDPVSASEPPAGLMLGLGLLALSAIALRRRRLNA
jgi:MYXO-CTERM domain-containing protein